MKNYTPLSLQKISGIQQCLAIFILTIHVITFFIYSANIKSGWPTILSFVILSLFVWGFYELINKIQYNYLTMKFKNNIHLEIQLEYQKRYDDLLIKNYGSDSSIEDLRKQGLPAKIKKVHIELEHDRDFLLRKF